MICDPLLDVAGDGGDRECGAVDTEPGVGGAEQEGAGRFVAASIEPLEMRVPPPTEWEVLGGAHRSWSIAAERFLDVPLGTAPLARDAHIGGAVGLAGLVQLQDRCVRARVAMVDVLHPGEIVEVTCRARHQKPCGYRARAAAVALIVNVAGPVGPIRSLRRDGNVHGQPAQAGYTAYSEAIAGTDTPAHRSWPTRRTGSLSPPPREAYGTRRRSGIRATRALSLSIEARLFARCG